MFAWQQCLNYESALAGYTIVNGTVWLSLNTVELTKGLAQQAITLDMLNPIMEISNAEATEMAVEERMGIAAVSELAAARVKKADGRGLELRHTSHIARTMCMPLSRTQDRFWSCVMQHRAQLAEAIWHTVGGLTQATELTLIKYTPSEAAQFRKVCICE